MVLLICSGLFLRSLSAARNIDLGLSHRNLLMVAFDPSLNRYSPGQTRRILDAVLAGARAIPGVESATLSSSVPLNLEGTNNSVVPEGGIAGEEKNPILADVYSVAPDFFETLGIRMIDGRDFRPGVSAEDVVIVNQALAGKAFPTGNPVGQRLSYLGRVVRIAGLVATTKSRTIGEDPRPCMYFPIARDLRGNDSLTGITLILRTRGNPAGYAPPVRKAIRDIDPALAVFDVRTMDTQLSRALFIPRVAAILFGLAGLMGVLISTVGIYGVVSFAVARRSQGNRHPHGIGGQAGTGAGNGAEARAGSDDCRFGDRSRPGARAQPDSGQPVVWRQPDRYAHLYPGSRAAVGRRADRLPGTRPACRVERSDSRFAI